MGVLNQLVSGGSHLVRSLNVFTSLDVRHKQKMWQLRERYLRPQEWGKKRLPTSLGGEGRAKVSHAWEKSLEDQSTSKSTGCS